uniref:Putative LOV domain-containing protein n=1 Tax=Ignatius tetrasporus TaxID=231078 RepID=A0A126WYN9_9CHLO|nr:putative LOV domain-containing protein [Ignatius tetrasporus]
MRSPELHLIDEPAQQALSALKVAYVISDPHAPDCPIVYASQQFLELTGYPKEQVVGRNCRFLQGQRTSKRKVLEMRDALREERACHVCLLNYKQNGEPFWNQFYLCPLFDGQQQLKYYVGMQFLAGDVSDNLTESDTSDDEDASVATPHHERLSCIEASLSSICRVLNCSRMDGEEVRHANVRAHQLPCSLESSLLNIPQPFVLVDANLPDMPVVFASDAFVQLTGYSRCEVVGKNCRFLQGDATNADDAAKINQALTAAPPQPVSAVLLNYRKDGTPFGNGMHISPVRGHNGKLTYFIGVHCNVTPSKVPADSALESPPTLTFQQKMVQKATVAEVRVAVRALSGVTGLRRCSVDQCMPRRSLHARRPLRWSMDQQRPSIYNSRLSVSYEIGRQELLE